jgi:hypothetical protein
VATTVSPGNLDGLLDIAIPVADFTDLAVQSFTTSSNDILNETLTSINVTATGVQPLIGATALQVVAVSDAQDTITLSFTEGGVASATGQLTYFVVGYGPNAILVSGDDSHVDAVTLSEGNPGFAAVSGIISGAPIPAGTNVTFSASGTSTLTSTPTPTPTPTPTTPPDILLQNTSGSLALWQMNGTAIAGGGLVGSDPGPTWHVEGKGNFFNDGNTDSVLQNTDGSVALWDMSGTSVIGGGLLANPGPAWQVKGTGTFFGAAGNTGIVLQNTDGSVALWEMNGITVTGGGLVGSDPGPAWQVKGTGDFFGDGNTDIVLQNTDGSVALWDVSGTSVIGGGLAASDPGPTWHVVGTGDFFGDGNTDIVLQNTDGSVALWDMQGNSIVGGGLVASNPGTAWHVKGTGSFFGDGNTDIILQNDNGSVALWDMQGTNIVGGGEVANNPGTAWNVLDNIMQFIYSASANETLTATPMTPDEFVFTSVAAGSHTIDGFNPLQDMIEFSKAQFASFTDVQAATSAVSGGAVINLGHGSSLLLSGADPGSLHASNFALA